MLHIAGNRIRPGADREALNYDGRQPVAANVRHIAGPAKIEKVGMVATSAAEIRI
jgi:hypothetical protein